MFGDNSDEDDKNDNGTKYRPSSVNVGLAQGIRHQYQMYP